MAAFNTDHGAMLSKPGCEKSVTCTDDRISEDSFKFIDGISDRDTIDSSSESGCSGCSSYNKSDSESVDGDESRVLNKARTNSSAKNAKNKRKRKRRNRGRKISTEIPTDVEESISKLSKSSPGFYENSVNGGPSGRIKTVPHQSSSESSGFCVELIQRQHSEVLKSPYDKDGERIIDPDGVPLDIKEKTSDTVDNIEDECSDNILNNVNGIKVDTTEELPKILDNLVNEHTYNVGNIVDEHKESDCADETVDTETSSSSDDETKLVESEKTQLQICGHTDFCWIDSRASSYRGKSYIRHYVLNKKGTDIIGDFGLRTLDELLVVNGNRLKNKNQKEVKSLFRKIRLDRKTSQVKIVFRVRRWSRDPARGPLHEKKWREVKEYVLNLVLVPSDEEESTSDVEQMPRGNGHQHEEEITKKHGSQYERRKPYARSQSFRVESSRLTLSKEERLSVGCIDILSLKGTQLYRYKSEITDQYISTRTGEEGGVSTAVITDTNTCVLRVEHFLGIDEAPKSAFSNKYIFCTRLCINQPTGLVFLSSNIALGHEDLKFVTEHKDDFEDLKRDHIIDERCFILRKIGSIVLFQSLIYRDHFISVNKDTGLLYLLLISKTEQNAFVAGEEQPEARGLAYYAAARKFQTCKFEEFKIKRGLIHGFHRALDGFIGRFLCGIGRTNTTEHGPTD